MDATIATVLIDNTRSFAKRMSSISTTETTSLERFKSFTIFSRRWLWKKWVCDFQLSSSIRKSDIGQAVPYVGRYTSKFCRSEEWNSTGRNLYSIWGASKIQSSERLWWIAVEQPSSTWSFPSPNGKTKVSRFSTGSMRFLSRLSYLIGCRQARVSWKTKTRSWCKSSIYLWRKLKVSKTCSTTVKWVKGHWFRIQSYAMKDT